MTIDILILVMLTFSALATVMTARVLRSVLGLALTSATVAIILFRMQAPLAAVFELSVGAGLVPAIFLSAIGMTERLTPAALASRRRAKLRMFWALPMVVVLAGVALTQVRLPSLPVPAEAPSAADVRTIVWNLRHMDLLGQILVLLGGTFSVVVLAKEMDG